MCKLKHLLFMAILPCSVQAQAQSLCEQLSNAIEASVKELSFYSMYGMLDDSAARETNRKLGQVLQIGIIQANLQIMQANKCALPKSSISENAYRNNAFQCEMASNRAPKSKSGITHVPECERATWDRNFVTSK